MARRKTGDNKVAVGNVTDVRGKVTIAGGDIYEGYTVEQVSLLLKQITTNYRRKPFDGRCPYKGLDVFEEEDAGLFFGRERLVEELIGRVKESRAVFITGPSGSGKSSLVRAGLIHALKEGATRNSKGWLYETMKPGREPLKDLALAFSRLKGPDLADYFQAHAEETDVLHKCAESVLSGRRDQRFVLFVDQFEEVFTQVNQETERVAFLRMLAHAGTVENGRVIILFAMRSDFVSNCAPYPAINELLSGQFRQIGAMQPEELVSAIALPAKKVGLPVEEELIARIINDMRGEPGALPLMQFALKELFEARQAKGGDIALTLEDYLAREGIQKMLARHADATLSQLSTQQQELARSIFSGLIEIGKGRQDTRRTALFEELVPADTNAEEVEVVVRQLADARLVITDEQAGQDTVTIAHERLITAWPWLEKLIDENRDVIALQNEIASDAKDWEDHQRDPSYLYTGARLANAREQLEAKKLVLSDLAQIFVDTGIEIERAQHHEEERRRQKELDDARKLAEAEAQRAEEQSYSATKLRQRSVYLTVALVAALIAAGAAVFFGVQSQGQATIAGARELGTQAILQRDKNFLLSLLLGVEAFHIMDLPITRRALLDNTTSNAQLIRYLSGYRSAVWSVAFSPNGDILASGSEDNTIILWDVKTGKPIGQPLRGHRGAVPSVAFSPNGDILASGSYDNTIILWEVKTGKPLGEPLRGHSNSVSSVAFSQDGHTLASGSYNGTILLWDIRTGKPLGEPLKGPSSGVLSVAFSPDGSLLASGGNDKDGTILLWDVKTGKPIGEPLRGHNSGARSVAFSPNGDILASGSYDNTIILWDVKTGKPIGQPLRGHINWVSSVAFSQDGNTLASGSDDNTILLWDVKTGKPIGQPLRGHINWVSSVAFSQDGNTLASGSGDSSIALWDVKKGKPIGKPLRGHRDPVMSVAFSQDSHTLASGSYDGTILWWDVKTGKPIGEPPREHSSSVYSLAFSLEGNILASRNGDSTIALWDVKTGKPIGEPLRGHNSGVTSGAFSPDGSLLVAGSDDGTILLWDVKTGKPLGEPLRGHINSVLSVAFSPDGSLLASGSEDTTILLWDVKTGKPLGEPLQGHGFPVLSVAFSPDGSLLASGHWNTTIILWDVTTHQPIGEPLRGHSKSVDSLAFSPDGSLLASGSRDNTIILWDVTTHQPIGEPLREHSSPVLSVAFSPDGHTLASASYDGTILLWDVNPQSWAEKSCQRAGRNFTRAEWETYLADKPYPTKQKDATCPQWPLEPEAAPAASPTP